ncbi:MAG: putative O-glycosylation ligase, exosortase A system-associated [Betaproteobacteria bacterium]|nr:MAG: putative O-glycosylation ligase, exosortase A system-associated [Betaproteobacteria bacterium]
MFSFRDIVLTAFILGLLPAVLFRPHWGILLWTWIGLMNPHKLTWGFAYNFPFAMIVGIVTMLAILISKEPKRLPVTAPVVVLFMWVAWMTITTVFFSIYPTEAWPKWDTVMKIQLFIFLTLLVMQSEERIRALVLVATLSIAYFGIKGGVYTIMHGGGGMVLGPDGGFISGNTEIALALTVTLPLMRWLQLQTQRRWLRHATTVAMVLIAVSVLGSYSRGGLLALAAVGVFFWFKSRKKLVLAVMIVPLAFALVAFMPAEWHEKMHTIETYEEDGSAMSRINAWKFAWSLAQDRPVGGGGFDTFQVDAYARWLPTSKQALDSHGKWFQVAHRGAGHQHVPQASEFRMGERPGRDDSGCPGRILGWRDFSRDGVLGLPIHPCDYFDFDEGSRCEAALGSSCPRAVFANGGTRRPWVCRVRDPRLWAAEELTASQS